MVNLSICMSGTGVQFVLVHSPLVGPVTWSLVAAELRTRGLTVLLPTLRHDPPTDVPYWRYHAQTVVQAIEARAEPHSVVLVAHSGAGPLLPAVQQLSAKTVAACIFVDAPLPHPGLSRLTELERDVAELAVELRQQLEVGTWYPAWTDDDLQPLVPDQALRSAVLQELRPKGLDYFDELLPAFSVAPNVPCAYLQFSGAYQAAAAEARRRGWPYRRIAGGHFHMLVDPIGVVDALVGLVRAPK